jgi:putative aldouronate transport system substrate-binding protein
MLTKGKGIIVLSLLLMIIFPLMIYAGGSSADTASQSSGAGVAAAPGSIVYPVTGSPKLSIVRMADPDLPTAGYSTYNEAPSIKALIKATGINLEFVEPVNVTALLLYLSAGNTSDIVIGDKNFYPGGVAKMSGDGLAVNLIDYLPKYAPDYWQLINSSPAYKNGTMDQDGGFYSVAGPLSEVDSKVGVWRGILVRKEFLDRLNMQPPQTPDEFYTFLKRTKDELGIAAPFRSDKFRFESIFIDGSLTSGFNLPSSGPYQINKKIHFGAYESQYKDVLAFLNKLFAERLLDNNFAVTDEPTANAAMLNGQSASMITALSRMQNMASMATSKDFTLYGLDSLVPTKGAMPMSSYVRETVQSYFWAFIPSNATKNIEYSLKLLNYLFTPKGIMLSNFGEEGLTYTMRNNEAILTEFMTKNPKGVPLDALLRVHAMLNFPLLQTDSMTRQRYPLPEQIQAMAAWARSDAKKYFIVNNSILPQFAEEYASLYTDINTYIVESRAQFISGVLPLGEFDSYIATLKRMGMDRLLEILQTSYNAYNR